MAILPLVTLFKSDYCVVLFNLALVASFPAIVFKLLKLLGLSGKACRSMMWLVPLCIGTFVSQTAGGGNDLLGIWLAACSLYFVLKFIKSLDSFYLPMLAVSCALLTDVKLSNGLLVAIYSIPVLWCVLRNYKIISYKRLVLAAILFIPASCLHVVTLNYLNTASLTGTGKGMLPASISKLAIFQLNLHNTLVDILQLPLMPPFVVKMLDGAFLGKISDHINAKLGGELATKNFEMILTAEGGAVGAIYAGILLVCIILVTQHLFRRVLHRTGQKFNSTGMYLVLSCTAGIGLLYLSATANGITRILSPFYFILLIGLITLAAASLRTKTGKGMLKLLAFSVYASTFANMLLIPTRPLLNYNWLLPVFVKASPQMADKCETTINKYGNRGRQLVGILPDEAKGSIDILGAAPQKNNYFKLKSDSSYDWESFRYNILAENQKPDADYLIVLESQVKGDQLNILRDYKKLNYELICKREVYFYNDSEDYMWVFKNNKKERHVQ